MIDIKPSQRNTNKHTKEGYCDVIVKRMIKLDDTLTVKRNGVDCTNEFKD